MRRSKTLGADGVKPLQTPEWLSGQPAAASETLAIYGGGREGPKMPVEAIWRADDGYAASESVSTLYVQNSGVFDGF